MIRQLIRRLRADFRAWRTVRRFRANRAKYLAAKARLAELDRAASQLSPHERARREAEQS